MAEEIHGVTCNCCERSQTAKEILEKVNSIIGKSISTNAEDMINDLKNISAEMASIGGIDDIVKISEVFFNMPLDDLDLEQLQLTDKDKTINLSTGETKSGPSSSPKDVKVSTLSDVPSLDISKVLDFPKLKIDLSALSKLKFSISVPTIVAQKMLKLGPITVGLQFHIHGKGFSWFPILGELDASGLIAEITTPKAAMEKLKAVNSVTTYTNGVEEISTRKFSQPVTAVDKSSPMAPNSVSLDEAKYLASIQYSDSKEVVEIINNSKTSSDFFNKLADLGVILTKDIDPLEQLQAFLDNEAALKTLLNEEKLIEDDSECGIVHDFDDLVPKPYVESELISIEKDCCSSEVPPVIVEDTPPVSIGELLDSLSNTLTEDDEKQAVQDVKDFMSDMGNCVDSIKQAGKEKSNATNAWYWFKEAYALNDISGKFVEKRVLTIDALTNSISSAVQSRLSLIKRNVLLKKEEADLIKATRDKLLLADPFLESVTNLEYLASLVPGYIAPATTGGTGASGAATNSPEVTYRLDGTNIFSVILTKIEQDVTFKTAIKGLRQEYSNNELEISNLSSIITDQKNANGLPSLSSQQINDVKQLGLQGILPQINANKQIFTVNNNPITNQVGYGGVGGALIWKTGDLLQYDVPAPNGSYTVIDDIEMLHLYVDQHIYAEAKALFELTAVTTGEISNYIVTTDQRKKKYATDVWDKFYTPNRIDRLFSYQEQGYTAPKPVFDENGNVAGPTTNIVTTDPLGNSVTQTVAKAISDFDVNQDVAIEFWSGETSGSVTGSGKDIDDKIKDKMLVLLNNVTASSEYNTYIEAIRLAAEKEAKLVYAANLIFEEVSYNTRQFDQVTMTYSFIPSGFYTNVQLNLDNSNLAQQYRSKHVLTYDAVDKFSFALLDKIKQLESFIEQKKKEMADGEKCAAEKSEQYTKKAAKTNKKAAGPDAPDSANGPVKKTCKDKLGYDPIGLKTPLGCPDFTKNCYWKEYTKIMQLASLMPVPDIENLTKRLFRYYPVGLQIPVISPTGVLPTLASGIPDAMISIPMPFIWKHVITLSTPIGLFVIWIALAGPIPCPYVMYIDENMESCFLVTLKGPIDIPAKSIRVTGVENKSLLEMLAPLEATFKVDVGKMPFKMLYGDSKIKFNKDADSGPAFIEKIKTKLKSASDGLAELDWSLVGALAGLGPQGPQSAFGKMKQRVDDALRYFPPDTQIIEESLGKLTEIIDKQIDELKISPIKFPKNPKKLITPVIGPAEFLDDINKLKDQGLALGDIGLGIKFMELRVELKKFLDRSLSTPAVKSKFKIVNDEIAALEEKLKLDVNLSTSDKVTERVKSIKSAIKAPMQDVADKITPEMLGFIAAMTMPIALPVPCYDKITISPIPPYILAIIAAIKALPSAIDAIPDDAFSKSINIDLSMPLPRVDDMIFFIIEAFLKFVPDLKFPDMESVKMLLQTIKAAIQNIFKIKIRMPHPGAIQIVITGDMIKQLIKAAVKAAMAIIIALIMQQLAEAIQNSDVAKVVAVAMIIKALFGTDLGDISGNDIKAFLVSMIDATSAALDDLKSLIAPFEMLKAGFKSIKDTLFPKIPYDPRLYTASDIPPGIKAEGPIMEISTGDMLALAKPLLTLLGKVPIPFPVVLLGCALTPTRMILTKLHPFDAIEKLPTWEKMSTKNLPFMIWIDQVIATAQRNGGFGSDYVVPYWMPDV